MSQEAFWNPTRNPAEAIDKMCQLCAGRVWKDIIDCPSMDCPFWEFRRGGPQREHRKKYGPRLRAIKAFCLDCQNGDGEAVKDCEPSKVLGQPCPLYRYRFGRGIKRRERRMEHARSQGAVPCSAQPHWLSWHPSLELPLADRQPTEEVERLLREVRKEVIGNGYGR